MHKITTEQFTALDLGDIRRNERFTAIINNVIEHSGQSIPQQNKNWYDTKATYHFFSNEAITLEGLQKAIHEYGALSMPLDIDCVLIPHDTSNLSFYDLQAKGLGYLDNKSGRGFLLHSSIAVSTQGTPLALLNQQIWTREIEDIGKAKQRKSKSIEEKESSKWLKGIHACNELLGKSVKKVHIGDREADIYELFFHAPEANSELLIRACQQRNTDGGSSLWEEISSLPLDCAIILQIPDLVSHKKIDTKVEVRYQKVKLLCPRSKKGKYDSVELTAIEVRQQKINDEEEGVCWKLLTTLEVKDIEDVKLYIRWYTYRWLIERFHYVIKGGCKIEALQLKQADSLKKAIVMYSLAGFIIMIMTYQSRETPEASCEVVLSKVEWQALYIRIHKTIELPQTPPTLQQVTMWIGKLGGHLGRKSDGPPGLKTIWRGYRELMNFLDMYLIMTGQQNLGKG